jgi:hypothetical protein
LKTLLLIIMVVVIIKVGLIGWLGLHQLANWIEYVAYGEVVHWVMKETEKLKKHYKEMTREKINEVVQ